MNLEELRKEIERLQQAKNTKCYWILQGIRKTVEALDLGYIEVEGSEEQLEEWKKIISLLSQTC